MALLTTPLVLNDGTANRTFSFRAQQPDKKSVVADYIEDAAPLTAESLIVVKHDSTGSVNRHLLQRKVRVLPAGATDGVRKRITLNLTVTVDPAFTIAEALPEFILFKDLLAETDLFAKLLQSTI